MKFKDIPIEQLKQQELLIEKKRLEEINNRNKDKDNNSPANSSNDSIENEHEHEHENTTHTNNTSHTNNSNIKIDINNLSNFTNGIQAATEINPTFFQHRNSLVGTAEYASPEMITSTVTSHLSTDIWAIGCIIYKFFHGKSPFKAENEMSIFNNIHNMSLSLSDELPNEAKDLMQRLLIKNPSERLGAGEKGSINDMEALKKHEFFKGINFDDIANQSPPVVINTYDKTRSSDNIKDIRVQFSSNDDFYIANTNSNQASSSTSVSPLKPSKIQNVSFEALDLDEFHYESYSDLNEEDIIEDYMMRGNNKKNGELVKEGIVSKKGLIVYDNRKLRLLANGKLEVWNFEKGILTVSIFKL